MSTGLLHVETMVRDGPGEGSASTWPKPRKRPLPGTHPDYPIKNLVLEGGGARGGAYCGALLELEKLGQTSHWRDCHFADTTSPFSRCFNRHGDGVSAK